MKMSTKLNLYLKIRKNIDPVRDKIKTFAKHYGELAETIINRFVDNKTDKEIIEIVKLCERVEDFVKRKETLNFLSDIQELFGIYTSSVEKLSDDEEIENKIEMLEMTTNPIKEFDEIVEQEINQR